MTHEQYPAAGALAGARAWAGGLHELGAAAVIAAHVLAAEGLPWLDLPLADAVPLDLRLQVDAAVDDVCTRLSGGGHAWFQARRTLSTRSTGPTALAAVVAQWAALDSRRSLDPECDRVVGLAERYQGRVAAAEQALRRGRFHEPGASTDAHRRALTAMRDAITGSAAADRVLACGVLHRLATLDGAGADRIAVERLLEARVVADGQGRRAWRALQDALGDVARLRAGLDRRQLLEILAEDCDLRSPRPGSAAAGDLAELAHRHRLVERAAHLSFAGLRAGVTPVERRRADAGVRAIEGVPPDSEDDPHSGKTPAVLIRVHGRLVLTGLPGAGKSTAMGDIAADIAQDLDATLPLLVTARAVLAALSTAPPRAALLDCATADAPASERDSLRAALDAALAEGRAAVLIDALDECADPYSVLRAAIEVLDAAGASSEAVVATREGLALDAARLTGWPAARLQAPLWPIALAREVLAATAAAERISGAEDWVNRRTAWVEDWLQSATQLAQTPLLVVLLAQLRAARDDDALPVSPAELLREAMWALVDRWESAKPDERLRVGGLQTGDARQALLAAFNVIGATLRNGDADAERVSGRVAEALVSGLGLAPLAARAAARDALVFWDRCGVFVLDEQRGRLAARARQLAELAAALGIVDGPNPAAWAAAHIGDEADAEVLRLAASLSKDVRDAAIRAAAADGSAGAVLRAARIAAESTVSPHAGELGHAAAAAAPGAGPGASLELALAAAQLADTAAFEALVESWPQPRQRTLLAARRTLTTDDRNLDALRALVALSGVERDGSNDIWALLGPNVHFSAAVVDAAECLLAADPGSAPALADRLADVSISDAGRLFRLLQQHGHEALAAAATRSEAALDDASAVDHDRLMADMYATQRTLLTWLAELAEPTVLTMRQRRGLSELASLWTALRIDSAPAFEPTGVLAHEPDLVREIVELAARLHPGELRVIAAEARVVLDAWTDAMPPDAMEVVRHAAGPRPSLATWRAIDDRARAQAVLLDGLGVGRWLPDLCFAILATTPVDAARVTELRNLLPQLTVADQRSRLASLLCWWQQSTELLDELAAATDPAVRRGAMRWLAILASTADEKERVARAADDPDDGVRRALLLAMAAPPLRNVTREALEAADWRPRPWRCLRCDHDNRAGQTGCERCNVVDGDARGALGALTSPT